MKLNIGCGNDIKEGYINQDICRLPGVDVVFDLKGFPWPFEDGKFEEIIAWNVLEHLPDTIRVMEELHRILKKGGKLIINVPYWNSFASITDPTHKVFFNEFSFDFFDVSSPFFKRRSYYSKAYFKIIRKGFRISPFSPYIKINKLQGKVIYSRFWKRILGILASYLNNVILSMEITMRKKEL